MSKTERIIYLSASVLGYFFISFLYLGILGNFLKDLQIKMISNIHGISFLIILWYYFRFIHKKINQIVWKDYFSFSISDIKKFVFGVVLSIIISMMAYVVGLLFNLERDFLLAENKKTLQIFSNNFVVAFAEELFFRGLIFFSLLKITNRIFLSSVVSSLFIALIHFGSIDKDLALISMLNIFAGGLVLSYLYFLSGSIWTAIGFHAMNNFLAVAPDFYNQISPLAFANHLLLHSAILVFASAVLVVIANRKKLAHQMN